MMRSRVILIVAVLAVAAVGAAVAAGVVFGLRRRGAGGGGGAGGWKASPGLGTAPLDAAIQLVDKMEWQTRSCHALGWLLGGVLSQVKSIPAQTAPLARDDLLRAVDADATVLVLPNLQPELRQHMASALRSLLRALWAAPSLTPRRAAAQLMALWDPACAAVRRRYGPDAGGGGGGGGPAAPTAAPQT